MLLRSLTEEEPDPDKVILALSATISILKNFIEEVKKGVKVIEISAGSSYFLGRIGGYKSLAKLLKDIGFNLDSKPYIGLSLTIKNSPQAGKKVKEYLGLINEFIDTFKNSRTMDQFLPDFESK